MKKLLRFSTLLFIPIISQGQCPTDLLTGQNLVINGDFSDGYNDWTYTADPTRANGYLAFNPPVTQNFSSPGFIHVGPTGSVFNAAFANFDDHTPGTTDNNMLMVDGICVSGIKLWSQSNIPMSPNTTYYFSVWVHALATPNDPPGTLQFDINGHNLPTTITAPINVSDGWVQYEASFNSTTLFGGAPPATVTINIENTTLVGCNDDVDFAIDDITFIPGCSYAAAGPQPTLGTDQTLCGKGGAVTLNSNVIQNATTTVTWSTGATGTGMGAPYSIDVSLPGTYSVCVSDNGSCTKADVVVVSNDYEIDLGPNITLCDPAAATLDAVFSGVNVTYQWYMESNGTAGWQDEDTVTNGKTATFFANTPGTYRVVVTDLLCGTREDEITVATTAPTPVNAVFCPVENVTLSVTPANSGKYKWWNHPTSTALANRVQVGGDSYTFSATASSDYTFWVEDTASFRTTIGPPLTGHGFTNPQPRSAQNETQLYFNTLQQIIIDSVYLVMRTGGSCPDNIGIDIYNSSNAIIAGGSVTYSFTAADGCVPNTNPIIVKMPLNITVPVGNGYSMRFRRPGNAEMLWYEDGFTWGQTYADAVTYSGPNPSILGWKPNSIPGMWRWVISAGNPCARVPVQAIYSCTLPVNLTTFTAAKEGENVFLQWTTHGEENSSHFIIERSGDGINFHPIGQVAAAGSSTAVLHYSFHDINPLPGISYYRLAEYDIDASRHYSQIEKIQGIHPGVVVSPNPTQDQFTVTFSIGEDEIVRGQLFNSLGELMVQKYFHSSNGVVSETVNLQHVASGVYYLQLSGKNQRPTVKIIKE